YNAEILHKAMSELKPKYKYILVSKYYHDITDKEIAEKMDMSPDNIRQHLARAKRELKKILETEYNFDG
ncbi:MAG: sigma-70 family RNA polymerase sigma factor, partial [Oscillospiraceae bacterium]|nr:sigma-70 family RNA polymerase sigma factor [Oscillospiraceae bacterium]